MVYNTAVQEPTKYTPFQVMFGRVARLTVDIKGSANYEPESKAEEFNAVDERDEERAIERKQLEDDVRKNIAVAQEKQNKYHTQKATKRKAGLSVGRDIQRHKVP